MLPSLTEPLTENILATAPVSIKLESQVNSSGGWKFLTGLPTFRRKHNKAVQPPMRFAFVASTMA